MKRSVAEGRKRDHVALWQRGPVLAVHKAVIGVVAGQPFCGATDRVVALREQGTGGCTGYCDTVSGNTPHDVRHAYGRTHSTP
jgi:hypothetical protein